MPLIRIYLDAAGALIVLLLDVWQPVGSLRRGTRRRGKSLTKLPMARLKNFQAPLETKIWFFSVAIARWLLGA
jgi:hypothetical protein